SDAFHEQIIKMPRILAAFDARWGDARTNLNVFIQLNMSLDRYDSKADGVLDGPTTTAWFDPWYVHLRRLGVKFRQGALRSFRLHDVADEQDVLHAIVAAGGPDVARDHDPQHLIESDAKIESDRVADAIPAEGEPKLAQYYVVATDAFRAELATTELRAHYY